MKKNSSFENRSSLDRDISRKRPFFRGIQKRFPRTTTKTNKPFLRPRQRSLAVKKMYLKTLEAQVNFIN